MARKLKTAKQMERHFKGIANHYRIKLLLLIDKYPGVNVDTLTSFLDANLKTISQHTRKLEQSGLIRKRYLGREVSHSLSPYGRKLTNFIKEFERNF